MKSLKKKVDSNSQLNTPWLSEDWSRDQYAVAAKHSKRLNTPYASFNKTGRLGDANVAALSERENMPQCQSQTQTG